MNRTFEHGRVILTRTLAPLLVLAVMSSACADSAQDGTSAEAGRDFASLTGQLLVAAPGMPDPRFAKTVIFMVRHDRDGAMGLVVNRVLGVETAARLAEGAGVGANGAKRGRKVRVHYGGPVAPKRGYVLHSGEYADKGTLAVTDKVSMTGAAEILHAMAEGKGPDRGFLAVGYAGWGPGQLEGEIARKDWVVVPSDSGLVFDPDMASKWRRAMDRHGIEL